MTKTYSYEVMITISDTVFDIVAFDAVSDSDMEEIVEARIEDVYGNDVTFTYEIISKIEKRFKNPAEKHSKKESK